MQASELLNTYHVDVNTWDEMYSDAGVREQYQAVVNFMQQLTIEELNRKEELARSLFMSQGITFTVYSSGEGAMGFDPTNNCVVNELHVRLAVGRNFSDCSPVKGTYKGVSQHRLDVGVSVSYENGRITEEPGTTLVQHPVKNTGQENSYRKYMEMMQQQ